MNLLLPLFLGAAALMGVPIALHLLRRKPKVRLIFPTLQFLGPSAVLETRRHRIRRWLTLLFRCLTILLIALAFARPFWNADRIGHGRAVVIAVDNSFSMQATGRWSSLRSWALGQLSTLGDGDRAGLLVMNPAPRWLVPMTDNVDKVRDALGALKPGYEATRYEPALRMGGDALIHAGAPDMALAWMADEQDLGWQGVNFTTQLPHGVKFDFPPPAAPPARQAAIVKTSWDTGTTGLLVLHVEIMPYMPEQDTRTLTVVQDGVTLATQKVTLLAHHPNHFDVPLPAVKTDRAVAVKVALDPDDLPIDDTFYAVHEPDTSRQVYLTPLAPGDGQFDFIRPVIDSTKATGVPLHAQDLPDTEWPVTSVVVVRGAQFFQPPLVSRLDNFLKAGGTAFLFLDGDAAQKDWLAAQHLGTKDEKGSEDSPMHLRNWDLQHPLLAPLASSNLMGLLDIDFYEGQAITGVDASPIATWEDGSTAIAFVSTAGRRFLVCGFDPEREYTDWPIRATFLPFVHSALVWLGNQEDTGADFRVGDAVPLPSAGTWTGLDGPGDHATIQVAGSVRPHAPGLYQFSANGQTRLFPINLKPEESDLTPYPAPKDLLKLISTGPAPHAQPAPAVMKLSREEAENQQRLWWWLLAAAVFFLLAELRLANRTTL